MEKINNGILLKTEDIAEINVVQTRALEKQRALYKKLKDGSVILLTAISESGIENEYQL